MEVLAISKSNEKEIIKRTVRVLKKGGVIVYPTDTSYGIGGDPTNPEAVEKIFKIKKRPKSRPVLMVSSSRHQAAKYAQMPDLAKLWPAPVTLVLNPKPSAISPRLIKENGIALRVPKNKLVQKICRAFGKPVISTSANLTGEPPLYDAKEVIKMFQKSKIKPDLIIDAKKLPKRKASTIIDARGGEIKLSVRARLKYEY